MNDVQTQGGERFSLRIYLIRHGETEWSKSGQHTGRSDIPLTPRGEAEATTLVTPFRALTFSRVFSSPRLRAQRTCELAGLSGAAEIEPGAAEWDYGDYEGQRSVDIRKTRSDWNIYRDGCPGGESPEQISSRADALIARLRTLEGNVALFSHGHFGRVLAARWIELTVWQAQHFSLSTASFSILGFEQNLTHVPALLLWNAVATPGCEPAVGGTEAKAMATGVRH